MSATVPESASPAVATADTPRPSRLATAVQLAVLCRDNSIDWPSKVQFSDDFPELLQFYVDSLAHFTALVEAVGVGAPRITRGPSGDRHFNAHGGWCGFDTWITFLEGPSPAEAVDDVTSAAIDDLAAPVMSR